MDADSIKLYKKDNNNNKQYVYPVTKTTNILDYETTTKQISKETILEDIQPISNADIDSLFDD